MKIDSQEDERQREGDTEMVRKEYIVERKKERKKEREKERERERKRKRESKKNIPLQKIILYLSSLFWTIIVIATKSRAHPKNRTVKLNFLDRFEK